MTETAEGPGAGVTLDALFRNIACARPDSIALVDPADRSTFTDGPTRSLRYAEADAAVAGLARRFHSLCLPAGSLVAVQLPNIVEGVLTLLALQRAGLVALTVPMLWRQAELVAALKPLDVRAFVTCARYGEERPVDRVCTAAVELFSLSFPCAFGDIVPDGVIKLDPGGAEDGAAVESNSGEADAIATFDAAPEGFFAIARNHAQWLAIGLATLLEARIESGDTIVATLPPASLAGIGAAFVPWLLSGGTLALAHGPSGPVSDRMFGTHTHLVAPAAAIGGMACGRNAEFASAIAVHRVPQSLSLDFAGVASRIAVDCISFGEIGAVTLRRSDPERARHLPLGPISAPSSGTGAPVVVETKLEASGEILLRGPMVARRAPGGGASPLHPDARGYLSSGFRGELASDGGAMLLEGPREVATVGGVRFGLKDLHSRIAAHLDGAMVERIEDPVLGERLRVLADDPAASQTLAAAGHSPLVVEAVSTCSVRRRAAG